MLIETMLLVLLVAGTYFNALSADFISDDIKAIVQNPSIGDINDVFSHNLSFLRPLLLFISYSLGGLDPAFYRGFNILFHMATVLVLYLILSHLHKGRYAFYTAAIYAVHPILTESVTWISGVSYPQYAFFLTASLLAYMISKKKPWVYYVSFALFLLSMFSSEKAVVMPLILILYELSFSSLNKNGKRIVPFAVLALVFGAALLLNLAPRVASFDSYSPHKTQFYNPLQQIPIAISSYLSLIFWPASLTLYHTGELTMGWLEFVVRWIVLAGFTVLLVVAFRKSKFVFFWLGFFAVSLVPSLIPYEIVWVVAERYVYLASIGIIAAVVYILFKTLRGKRSRQVLYVVLSTIIVILMIRSIVRNRDWQNEDRFWIATSKVSPSSYNARVNAGNVYLKEGNYELAKHEYEESIRIIPSRGDGYHNLANAYIAMNNLDMATRYYKKALSMNPNIWQSRQNLAAIYIKKGDLRAAHAELLQAVAHAPENTDLRRLLTDVAARMSPVDSSNR